MKLKFKNGSIVAMPDKPAKLTSQSSRPVHHCVNCGAPSRVIEVGGIKFSDTAQYLGLCAKCVNEETE